MSELEELLGVRVVIKPVTIKIVFDSLSLEIGQEFEVIKVDPDLDRALIEYHNGKLDWKRGFWIREHSKKK